MNRFRPWLFLVVALPFWTGSRDKTMIVIETDAGPALQCEP